MTYWLDMYPYSHTLPSTSPRVALLVVSIYIGSIILLAAAEGVSWWRESRRRPAKVAQLVDGLTVQESLPMLSPRELVLLLNHLDTVGRTYVAREACDGLISEVRQRLRETECCPALERASAD
jgi:hypothetical protein